ncbi:hypothetical protein BHE74_00041985 [Ensete ventricosum]|nr:hypothetical protein BHE74_00041985 [Ensete ventricosum]
MTSTFSSSSTCTPAHKISIEPSDSSPPVEHGTPDRKKDQRTPRTRYQSTNAGGLPPCVQAANMDPVEQISLTSCALESVSSLGCLAMDPRGKDLRRWLEEPLDRSRPWQCHSLFRLTQRSSTANANYTARVGVCQGKDANFEGESSEGERV